MEICHQKNKWLGPWSNHAITLYSTILPFLAQCEKDQETRIETDTIPQTKYKCDLCEFITKEPTDVLWHHLECQFKSA